MDLTKKHCIPCEGGFPPMSNKEENEYIKKIKGWTLNRNGIHKISKYFVFKNFVDAMAFVNNVALIAEQEGHHPDIHISYNKVLIESYTHAIKGLSENDFILAAKIDKIADKKNKNLKKNRKLTKGKK
ncbi:MAG: 4a-hydroxytetrahydrobiopterin dehydratase [Candidatus Anstonellales archaeon]